MVLPELAWREKLIKISHKIRWLWLGLGLLLGACAAAPVQEMSNARQALDAARKAGAETHAPQQLKSADDRLQRAEEALMEGDYKKARAEAEAAREQAVRAQDESLHE